MHNNLLKSISFIFIFASRLSLAQEISLDPVTITSSLAEKRASETGRNIAVIKGDYFQNLPVHSIDDLLRYIPGLEVQARGPMGAQSDIVLRGGTFQQVLVVLDGLRLNDPNTGHFSSYIPISPSEIERIEVLKGASAAIYGSEAVGGVVHVISKTFAARLSEKRESDQLKKSVVNAAVTGGDYGLFNINAGGFVQNEKIAVAAGVLSNNANGVQQRGTRGYFHNNTASASLKYAVLPDLTIGIRSSFDHRDFAAQNFYTTFASDTANEQVKTLWNQIQVGYKKEKSSLSFNGGYKYVQDQYLYNSVSIRNNSKSRLWQGLLTWQQTIGEKTDFTAGMNYQRKNIASNDRGNHTLNQLAPFASLSHRVGAYFTISPAIRLDWRQNIGSEAVPQVSLSYKRKGWQLRGSAGKTIRDADFTERYNNYGKSLVTGGSVGNPALKAERSFSYEAGADWFLNTNLKISGTFFQRRQRDLIDYTTTPYDKMPRKENLSPTGTFALAENIATVNTTGFELDVQYVQNISERQHVYFNAGLTRLSSESSNLTPSFYVSSHAKFMGNFSAIYRISAFSVSVNGLYKTRAQREASAIQAVISKQYFVLNTKVDYTFLKKRLSVFMQIDNIFNTRYSDLLGAQMPGSWAMGGLRFQWVNQ
jgi:vitamin B12 transporter